MAQLRRSYVGSNLGEPEFRDKKERLAHDEMKLMVHYLKFLGHLVTSLVRLMTYDGRLFFAEIS